MEHPRNTNWICEYRPGNIKNLNRQEDESKLIQTNVIRKVKSTKYIKIITNFRTRRSSQN